MANVQEPPRISAYIPCCNNEDTISESVQSLLKQSIRPTEVFIIDDGSSDSSAQVVREMGVEVLSNDSNRGRGYSRAKAMERAKHEWVLCCDATNSLEPDFLAKAMPYFEDPKVVSVSGLLRSSEIRGVTARWRSRHLFKEDVPPGPAEPCEMLITYGTLMRKPPVMEVGNYNRSLTHTEDNELGLRLYAAGYKIIGAPDPIIRSIAKPRFWKTLERYWRWHAGKTEKLSLRSYLHNIKASIRPMAQFDLAKGDWPAALVSLFCPHYCFWKTLFRKF
jgi:cellulose synthase/poly-beta-1,6-N-acetylglucosamine synthase-like glycosyltransferase